MKKTLHYISAFICVFVLIISFASGNLQAQGISKPYSEEDIKQMQILGKKVFLNGIKLDGDDRGTAIVIFDSKLGKKYEIGRNLAGWGCVVWLAGITLNVSSMVNANKDNFNNFPKDNAGQLGNILAPTGLMCLISGLIVRNQAIRKFRNMHHVKYGNNMLHYNYYLTLARNQIGSGKYPIGGIQINF